MTTRPTPALLAGTQAAINRLNQVPQDMADDDARFEDTFRHHINDVLRINEEFLDKAIPPGEAAVLTLATIMLTPEDNSYDE